MTTNKLYNNMTYTEEQYQRDNKSLRKFRPIIDSIGLKTPPLSLNYNTMTTNKLVRLEDVIKSIEKSTSCFENDNTQSTVIEIIESLPTYSEPTKGSNHAILQEYIDDSEGSAYTQNILEEIQSRLTEGTEYEIGKEYEFSDDGKEWKMAMLESFETRFGFHDKIRPIQVSPELTQAISVLEANGYTVCKK